jgi:cyclopropane fatty-acyl-phospholipid synthase-like methyltransferase
MAASFDNALTAPAVARNRDPILAVLREVLAAPGTVLEIASGSGEHAVHFASALSHLVWQPTDPDAEARRSIAAHAARAQLPNLLPPLALDAAAAAWPVTQADAIVSINMIHIAPWSAAEGLMAGAARLLPPDSPLYLYGPFREHGRHTAPSNAAFDESLKARDPAWGVRDLDEVVALASRHGLALSRTVAMPANNLSVIFRRNP